MFRFIREKILPLFLARQITIYELSKVSGVSHRTCQRVINGEKSSADVIGKIGLALGIGYDEQPQYIAV